MRIAGLRWTFGLWFTTLALTATAAPGQTAGLAVEPDEENVVARGLVGAWELDGELTGRLGGRGPATLAFESRPEVAATVPARYAAALEGARIYMAGHLTAEDTRFPFLLVMLHGQLNVVFFEARDGEPMGDAESFIVALASAREPLDDLLLVGGDFAREPFAAYRRVRPTGVHPN